MSVKSYKLNELNYTIFDTETTGLSPYKGAKLVEIGAVRLTKGISLDVRNIFSELIDPQVKIPYSAYKIHKIDNSMVAGKPKIHEILPAFSEYTKDTVVVAHNAKFDYSFIDYFMKEHEMQCSILHIIDTLQLTKTLFPEIGKYNLDNLINYFDLADKTGAVLGESKRYFRHRALFDAVNTAFVFMECIRKINKLGLPDKLGYFIK